MQVQSLFTLAPQRRLLSRENKYRDAQLLMSLVKTLHDKRAFLRADDNIAAVTRQVAIFRTSNTKDYLPWKSIFNREIKYIVTNSDHKTSIKVIYSEKKL